MYDYWLIWVKLTINDNNALIHKKKGKKKETYEINTRIIFFVVLVMCTNIAKAEFVDLVAKIKPSVVGIGIHTPTSRPQNIYEEQALLLVTGTMW